MKMKNKKKAELSILNLAIIILTIVIVGMILFFYLKTKGWV